MSPCNAPAALFGILRMTESLLTRARWLIDRHRHNEAVQFVTQHLAARPDDPDAHALMALCLVALGRDQEAQSFIDQAIHLAPDECYGHYLRSFILRSLEDSESARRAIDEALRLSPNNAEYYARSATLLNECGRHQDGLVAATQGLAADPEHPGCACERAFALMCLGKVDDARLSLQHILARYPEQSSVHATLGWVALQGSRDDIARSHFTEALRIDPANNWAERGLQESRLRWLRSWGIDEAAQPGPDATIRNHAVIAFVWCSLWLTLAAGFASVRSRFDPPTKSFLGAVISLVVMGCFVRHTINGMALVLFSEGRRWLSGDQVTAAVRTWIMWPAAVCLLAWSEVHRNQTLYSLGCVLLWATPQFLVLATPDNSPVRRQLLWLCAAYWLTGAIQVATTAWSQSHQPNVYGSIFWMTMIAHGASLLAFFHVVLRNAALRSHR